MATRDPLYDPTGRTRLRTVTVRDGLLVSRTYLVLQVEVPNLDTEASPRSTLWRDATTEDLAALAHQQAPAPWAAGEKP
jgi:hypothetical protein